MSGFGGLSGVALDCREPAALADFYSRLTGWPVVYAHPDWYSVGESEGSAFHLSFQRAPGHRPPIWPDPASSMQLHLHFRVDDLDAAEGAVLALGGSKFDDQARAGQLEGLRRPGRSSVLPRAVARLRIPRTLQSSGAAIPLEPRICEISPPWWRSCSIRCQTTHARVTIRTSPVRRVRGNSTSRSSAVHLRSGSSSSA